MSAEVEMTDLENSPATESKDVSSSSPQNASDNGTEEEWLSHRRGFAVVAGLLQIVLVIFYGLWTEYGSSALASSAEGTDVSEIDHYYPLFQDVHVMIFIGFGFLMTFLKKYGFSSVGYNFIIAAFVIQWSILVNGFFHQAYAGSFHNIQLSIEKLITGDFAAGAVLITFGAVLGKTNPMQMLIVAVLEVIFYAANETIGASHFQAVDMGGSIFVHTFGAYFGLALSRTISKADSKGHPKNGSSKNSDMFAMIGTLFLWMFWPSFNGALALESQQHRVVINTVLALAACCVSAFLFDGVFRPGHKFDMVSIQNATLAGGVAVGSSSDLVIQPWGAITIGFIAGLLSVVGYVYIQPALEKCMGLDDTCGVNNLHGMPGIMGALGGSISAALASDTLYGSSIATVFAARAPTNATAAAALGVSAGLGRSAGEQAAYQFYALLVTLAFAIIGGIITGFVVKCKCFLAPGNPGGCACGASTKKSTWYDDSYYWEVPSEDEHEE